MKLARSQGKYVGHTATVVTWTLMSSKVILNPAPAQKLPDDVYAFIDCLIMNETETDILREAATPLSADNMETFEGDSIARGFFEKGVRDLVVITLGSKVRTGYIEIRSSVKERHAQSRFPLCLLLV